MGVGKMQKDNSVEQIIGKRIQKLRQEKGYTQQQFAEKIHFHLEVNILRSNAHCE